MSGLSISFTVGKASGKNSVNINHNNRNYVAKNVDRERIKDNIEYKNENVEAAYEKLFGAALAEYNARQNRPCRKINDYYKHIFEGKREEAFYEFVVQFGSVDTAKIGTENGELATKMLDNYMRDFEKRNPNLHVFNAVMHLDESCPHLHIDVIPFYTEECERFLKKGVSFRRALDEQGFKAANAKQNRLVAFEEKEREELRKILEKNGLSQEHKNAKSAHVSVDEYKSLQDLKRLPEVIKEVQKTLPTAAVAEEITRENVENLKRHIAQTEAKNSRLEERISSPLKPFFYSSDEKREFVQSGLERLGIPFFETENGFECQEYFREDIREIEKKFAPQKNPQREILREKVDVEIALASDWNDFLERLKTAGYEVKTSGKYVAAKPPRANNFVRLKSLGEDYSEQSLRNRIVKSQEFLKENERKLAAFQGKNTSENIDYVICKTISFYVTAVSKKAVTARKINVKKPFSWTNDAVISELANINKMLNAGNFSPQKLRSNFEMLEKNCTQKSEKIITLEKENKFFTDIIEKAKMCFGMPNPPRDMLDFLTKNNITSGNLYKVKKLVGDNQKEISRLKSELDGEQTSLKELSKTLGTVEKILAGTYVQGLVRAEIDKKQADFLTEH